MNTEANARFIEEELAWFNAVIEAGNKNGEGAIKIVPVQEENISSSYSVFITKHELGSEERFVLLLAFIPHIRPDFLDSFFQKNADTGRYLTELGGRSSRTHPGFIPTAETAFFLLAKKHLETRIRLMRMFETDHVFTRNNILTLSAVEPGESKYNGALCLTEESLHQIFYGRKLPPAFSTSFPAMLINTDLEWNDLVLRQETVAQINEIKMWLRHIQTLRKEPELYKKIKPGYKVLFHGPPGTGKTLAARLLGKETGRDVFRIDLSMIVSKYVGETEKNLSRVFDKAEHSGAILFFDEADALFGSRTNVNSAHDRYANQEVSFLLQRIEDYNGLIILASNFKNNIDFAFLRRFDLITHFSPPREEERLSLWNKAFPATIGLAENVNMKDIAKAYELTGANIANIAAHCILNAIDSGRLMVDAAQLRRSIARELAKEGRTS